MPAAATLRSESLVVRSPRRDEAPEVAELLTAATSGWLGWPETTASTILGWWESAAELEQDARVAVAPEGLIGYALLLPRERWRSTFWVELWTRPAETDESTTVRALLADLQPRIAALSLAAPPAATVRLRLQVEESSSALREVLEERGFEIVRSPIRMIADLDRLAPPPSWPDGIRLRTFVPADARNLYAFLMKALGDTWEFAPEPFESWILETEAAEFDPSLWWLAESEGELVGAMLCRTDPADPGLGWLHVIGVSRAWRRRSLGRALVQHALHELQAREMRTAGLGVDADNPTGASLLAESNGFRVAQRFWTYERQLRGPRHIRRLLNRAGRVVGARR